MVAIRKLQSEDLPFVISAWSASYRTSFHAGLLSMETYAEVMHREIRRIVEQPEVTTLVAYEPNELDHLSRPFLYGFLTFRRTERSPYVYYVYTKTAFRNGRSKGWPKGIASQLFDAAKIDPRAPFSYACRTGYCVRLSRKIPRAEWNPLPARYATFPESSHEPEATDEAA